jgi:hypothetical protein
MTYVPSSADWKWDAKRSHPENNWKVGMLWYRRADGVRLKDLHIIANPANRDGYYSDVHITLVVAGNPKSQHIYYQLSGDQLVADYALAPKGWRATIWIDFPELREAAEREALAFAKYCASQPGLKYKPGTVDPKDKGEKPNDQFLV